MIESSGGPSAFRDLFAFVACPRVNSLALSVDGTRLVAAGQTLSGDGTRYVSGLWEIDPAGERDALRLTRSDKGESGPVFGPDGTLYFLSERAADGDGDGGKDEGAALWALPPRGEAVVVARHPGGIAAVTVARDSGALCHTAGLLPGAADAEAQGKLRAARKDAKVTAILYETGPTRAWDHDQREAGLHFQCQVGPTTAVQWSSWTRPRTKRRYARSGDQNGDTQARHTARSSRSS
ncbi:hypothetical protein ACIP2Y_44535 [Streptomyces sviceus]|uniref:hypothetical protein n=1 Tax=Streptomyces sviceus TaxID=285530 RepID=UPI0037F7C27F